VRLEKQWIEERLEVNVSERDVERFRQMDDPDIIERIYDLGCKAAEQQVQLEDLLPDTAATPAAGVAGKS
jgi:hypothetical protein